MSSTPTTTPATPKAVVPPPPHEIRVYGHSKLFYWWPIWMLSFLFALTIFWLNRGSRWRWLGFLWPAGMLFTVVATANHWWLDGVGGATTVLIGLVIAWRLSGGLPMPWEWRPRRA